ncbi:MAG: hypothetical protein KDE27_01870 [Planctomycetes bacterium]|nr:hypothetical protein [Planctomycetota bacterium]
MVRELKGWRDRLRSGGNGFHEQAATEIERILLACREPEPQPTRTLDPPEIRHSELVDSGPIHTFAADRSTLDGKPSILRLLPFVAWQGSVPGCQQARVVVVDTEHVLVERRSSDAMRLPIFEFMEDAEMALRVQARALHDMGQELGLTVQPQGDR